MSRQVLFILKQHVSAMVGQFVTAQPVGKWTPTYVDDSCGPFWSPFITFLGVIGFFPSISFQLYRWCHHQNFNVSLGSFSFFLSLFFSLVFFYCKLCRLIFKIEESRTWYMRLICNKYHLQFSKLYYFSIYILFIYF